MESNGVGLEQRLSSLQTQIDHLRHANHDDVRPLEQRLSTLTEYSASILRRWDATADRHARAVSQLEAHLHELGDAGARLKQDTSQRLQDLERLVQQEWAALRDLHAAPVKQLVEQAANLTEVCIATANSAQHGFDRAEARLATLEADFHRATSELTREVQTLLTEVRHLSATAGPRQLGAEPPAWPLEDVTRLHHQLRESAGSAQSLHAASPALGPQLSVTHAPIEHETAAAPGADGNFVRAETTPSAGVISAIPRGLVIGAAAVVILIGGAFIWQLRSDVRAATAQAEQSQREAQSAAAAASREAAERQQAAARQLLDAQQLAARAQTIGDVLAAPDLIRYTLVNPGAVRGASGQVLWSRSRGFVLSASGLSAAPPDTTYQVWMLTRGGAVSAATFLPDAAGRATVTANPNVPRPVYGAIVTLERQGGAATPSGDPVLTRVPVAPAAAE